MSSLPCSQDVRSMRDLEITDGTPLSGRREVVVISPPSAA